MSYTPADSDRIYLLNVKECADILRIRRAKVYDLIALGSIKGFKIGSDFRIHRSSVESLIGAKIPADFFAPKASNRKK
ncbi:MAG TPA: helix-turn-helix domain-containing protein [Oligoflexia bacterium]|nr:helix-turn-helix domain-containing protein [Oligoflexia bacterium]HMP27633.1 helix-turn-helix domain-containing protein [Oligoflexia bacterium]